MERLKQRGFSPGKQDSGIHGNTVSGREAKRKEETPEIGPASYAMYFRATLIYEFHSPQGHLYIHAGLSLQMLMIPCDFAVLGESTGCGVRKLGFLGQHCHLLVAKYVVCASISSSMKAQGS